MSAAELAARIPEALLSDDDDSRAVVEEVERRASAGCSVSARALVNARDTLVELAIGESAGAAPSSRVRDRLLASAGKSGGPETASSDASPLSDVRDASGIVANLHIGTDEDRARTADVDAMLLAAGTAPPEPGAPVAFGDVAVLDGILAELDALLGYRLFLVAILRGDSAYHPTTRGKTPDGVDFRRIPRDLTFCTHCVSGGRPVRVENAASEPFFRGNRLVWGFGARAYAGVPLVSSTGVSIGTLCCIHDVPRHIPDAHLDVLTLYAERVVGELERGRAPSLRDAAAHAPSSGAADATAEGWFLRLLELELRRAREPGPDEGERVVALGATSTPPSAVEEGDVVGCVGSRHFILRARGAPFAWGTPPTEAGAAQWIAAASRAAL